MRTLPQWISPTATAAIPADFYRALRLPNNRASAPSSLPTESRISMTGWRSDKSAPEAPGQSRTHSAGSDPPARPRPGTNGRQRVCRAGSGSSLHSRCECPRLSRDLKDNGIDFSDETAAKPTVPECVAIPHAGRARKSAWDFNDSAAFYETKALCYRLSRSPRIDRMASTARTDRSTYTLQQVLVASPSVVSYP